MVSDKPWSDFTQADYSPEQWKDACLLDRGTGEPGDKNRYGVPVKEPGGALNKNGVIAAADRLDQVQGISPGQRAGLARKLVALYDEINMPAPDHLKEMAGDAASGDRAAPLDDELGNLRRGDILERAATIDRVDFGERILTVVAVPYEQPTPIEHRSQVWNEVFSRAAFNGFDPAAPNARSVPVSAQLNAPSFDHIGAHLVGKVTAIYPDRSEGLVLDMRISQTPVGDETLQLAHDRALYPSVGFAARSGDVHSNHRTRTRRVNRAFLDHVSMVPKPAYAGAKILAMRGDTPPVATVRDLEPLVTPRIDDFYADPLWQWAEDRLGGK